MNNTTTSAGAKPLSPQASTLIGLAAVIMWSASIGLFRSISELLGPLGGAAMIFTASGIFASLAFGLRVKDFSPVYLWGGGALFVAYEISLAFAVGLAHSRAQSLELGMINYLWPSLTVLLAVLTRQQRSSWLLLPAVLLCLSGIVFVMKGDGDWSAAVLWGNVQGNPLAYGFAFAAAFIWAGYSLVARIHGKGKNAVPLFLLTTAALLWIKFAFSDAPAISFSLAGIGQVLLLGLLTSAAYSCWNFGVQRGNITLLATSSYFTPILSMLLGSLWLGVKPAHAFLYGVLMVTAGSFLCWWATRTR